MFRNADLQGQCDMEAKSRACCIVNTYATIEEINPYRRLNMTHSEIREQIIIENEGQKIFGVMHRPLTKAPCPAVLICHGLGGHKVGKHRLYVHLAHRLASIGIAALRIDFRGSGDSEGEFIDMTIESELSDALKALNYLQNDPSIDHDKIAIFGRSFGGVIAVLAAHHHKQIKSMALWAPVFSGDQWKEQWEMLKTAKLSDERKEEMMSIEGMKPGIKFFQQLLALDLSAEMHALNGLPLLHIHGQKDTLVTTRHAEKYVDARQEAKAKSKFLLLSNTDHDFSHAAERASALEESVKWFNKTLNEDSGTN